MIIEIAHIFFALWLIGTLTILYRGTWDYAIDAPKNLKFTEFFRKDTTLSTKLLIPVMVIWIMMFVAKIYNWTITLPTY